MGVFLTIVAPKGLGTVVQLVNNLTTKDRRKSATIEVAQQLKHWLWKNY